MTRRSRLALLAAVVLLEVAVVAFVTDVPMRWTKGVVLPDACAPVAGKYACQVELVSDGTRVSVLSDRPIAPGASVRLVGWRDLAAGTDTYTVVR